VLSSRPREGRKRGEGKKKERRERSVFFAFGSDLSPSKKYLSAQNREVLVIKGLPRVLHTTKDC
jgi:hypothetical protein